MKHIKSFLQINEEFRSTQKLRGHIFESQLLSENDALDQLLKVWHELKEPIECIDGWYKLPNYKRICSILVTNQSHGSFEAEDYLGNKIITLVKKMEDICADNRLVMFYFGRIQNDEGKELWTAIQNIFEVLPTNSEWLEEGWITWKDEYFEKDRKRFYVGYQAYLSLPDLIQKYKKPVKT